MSTICTCGNSNKTTGFACNYSEGCPFNGLRPVSDPIENRAAAERYKDSVCACGSTVPCGQIGCMYEKTGMVQDIIDESIKRADKQGPARLAANIEKPAHPVADKVELIFNEYAKSINELLPSTPPGWLKVFGADKDTKAEVSITCDRRIIIELPNGVQFRIKYNNHYQGVEIIKVSDFTDGALAIQPGSSNQIFIK